MTAKVDKIKGKVLKSRVNDIKSILAKAKNPKRVAALKVQLKAAKKLVALKVKLASTPKG